LQKEPVAVGSIIREAVESCRPLWNHRGQNFVVAPLLEPCWVEGDPARLVQILVNLLSNAVKYTSPGGQISLTARRAENDVFLQIRDDGEGIAPDLLPRVFDLFVQGEQTLARSSGGLGLGLALVKRLVEMHGGQVTAASGGSGCGSTFVVQLPT